MQTIAQLQQKYLKTHITTDSSLVTMLTSVLRISSAETSAIDFKNQHNAQNGPNIRSNILFADLT